jgi:hypothetical protein
MATKCKQCIFTASLERFHIICRSQPPILEPPTKKFLESRVFVSKSSTDAALIAEAHSVAPVTLRSDVCRVPESNDRSFDRALPRRDITVPAGQPNKVAISW